MRYEKKFTFEKSRELAEQILLAYEGGVALKELSDHFKMTKAMIWQKIKQARKWRARKAVEQRP